MGSHSETNVAPRAAAVSLPTTVSPGLRPFQRRFLRRALAPGVDIAALSLPRGGGKSWLAAYILQRCLTPGDDLFVQGAEYLLCSGSLEQARIVFRFLRTALEPTGEYRWLDSTSKVGITHKATNTRLRVMSSNGKTAFGIVGCPLLVADEPGAWEATGGQLMWDAITGSIGKPNSPMRVLVIGTLAPATDGWWADLIKDGSTSTTYVQALQGNPDKWDSWPEVKRVNPLTAISPEFAKRLKTELHEAKGDTRLKARFLSYRLNVPTGDESTLLLEAADFTRMADRDTPPRDGQPIVAVDLGGGRAWSAAVAVWHTGRIEALALAPGLPDLDAQEKRDRVSKGLYQQLFDRGLLSVADGLRVQPPGQLWDSILSRWGCPVLLVCDRFRLNELEDAVDGMAPIEPRVSRWSEAAADIRALRKLVKDGPFVVDADSRLLVAASLSAAFVKTDDQGSFRLVKKSTANTSRDDVAAALVLVAGAFMRYPPVAVAASSGPIVV